MALTAVHANHLKRDQLFSILLLCTDFHVSSHFSLAYVFPQCLTFPPQSPGLFYSKLIRGSSELICRNPWTQLFFSSVVNFPLLLFPLRFNTSTFMLLWFSLWRRRTRKCWINLLPSLSLSILYSHFCIAPSPRLSLSSAVFTSGFFFAPLDSGLGQLQMLRGKSEIVMFGWLEAVMAPALPDFHCVHF